MKEQTSTFKEFTIEINPQEPLGDNTKVFFRVLKGDETELTLWQTLSGSEYRGLKTDEIFKKIIEDGITNARALLDDARYQKGSNHEYHSSN